MKREDEQDAQAVGWKFRENVMTMCQDDEVIDGGES
jgi:hypothetical protein